jgi:hypothetical protein
MLGFKLLQNSTTCCFVIADTPLVRVAASSPDVDRALIIADL